MKRFLLFASVICLYFSLSTFAQIKQDKLIKSLLDLPAPAAFLDEDEEEEIVTEKEYAPEFFEKSKVPPDDAPIEDLLAYWSRQSVGVQELRYSVKPSKIVVERLLNEIEKQPGTLRSFVNIFPSDPEVTAVIKRIYDQQNEEFQKFIAENKEDSEIPDTADINQILNEVIDATKNVASENSYYGLSEIKKWLTYNSDFFVDELIEDAKNARDKNDYVVNHDELLALAKVDWKSAEPIVEKLNNDPNQPVSSVLAKWAYYRHFLQKEDESEIDKYRRALQDVVEDKNAKPGARDLAMDALVGEEEWDGRDDWYVSLLEDETLFELKVGNSVYTGLTTIILNSPPEKWIPKMIALVGNQNQAVHNAAVRNLSSIISQNNKDAIKALIPWLSNPDWAKDINSGRRSLISAVGSGDFPESVPGLIWIVQNEESYRSIAASALATYNDPRIVPLLQSVLAQEENRYQRDQLIRTILAKGGYSAAQQIAFLEEFAKLAVRADLDTDNYYALFRDENTVSLNVQIGIAVSSQTEPNEDLVRTAHLKIKELRRSNLPVAEFINNIVQSWKSPFNDLERLTQIGNGTADLNTVIRVLTRRREIAEKFKNEVYSLRTKKGFSAGIAGCLLQNNSETAGALNTNDPEEKAALLACARMIRAKLSVAQVGQILNSSEGLLKNAAESYLISEDSAEARNLVLANRPSEALILGARFSFSPEGEESAENVNLDELFASVNTRFRYLSYSPNTKHIDKFQKKLREEAIKDASLQGIYALIQNEESGHKVLRIYKDKAVYRWYEDAARFNERALTNEELNAVFRYISESGVVEQKPIIGSCDHGCKTKELVMFGRNGGRRIFVHGYGYQNPIEGLERLFSKIEQGKASLHYHLQDKLTGLEVLLADKNYEARSVWKQGDDLRILVLDKVVQKQIESSIEKQVAEELKLVPRNSDDDEDNFYERYSEIRAKGRKLTLERSSEPVLWREFKENKLQIETVNPPGNLLTFRGSPFPGVEGLEDPESVWNTRTRDFEFRTGNYEKNGLWKVAPNGSASKVSEGRFDSVVVTPDGKWAVVEKQDEDSNLYGIYRIDLQTGKSVKVTLPNAPFASPTAFVSSHNSILISNTGTEDFENFDEIAPYYLEELKKKFGKDILNIRKKTEYYLLNPQTGALKPVSGEFLPLEQITYRNLQSTGKANESWAAIYIESKNATEIGLYDASAFKFTKVMEIPEIELSSMDIWVNEKDAKVYFVYEGHVLSLPLPKAGN